MVLGVLSLEGSPEVSLESEQTSPSGLGVMARIGLAIVAEDLLHRPNWCRVSSCS
jgi:hypothetical protein